MPDKYDDVRELVSAKIKGAAAVAGSLARQISVPLSVTEFTLRKHWSGTEPQREHSRPWNRKDMHMSQRNDREIK